MMGTSGGRARRHPTGEGARRRANYRERQQIDPPRDLREPAFQLTERGHRLVEYVFCVAAGGSLGTLIGIWFSH